MKQKKTYAVFGLGRYGRAAAVTLAENGAEVLAVDRDAAIVEDLIDTLPVCKCADVTDADVLEALDVGSVDVVIIAMGGSLESSVLTTMLCKDAGVGKVIVKCADELQRRILERVGADQVVFPEYDSGVRLAHGLLNSGFADIFELSPEISMLEIPVRPEWAGKSLQQLDMRRRYGVNVIAVMRDETVSTEIDPAAPLEPRMRLFVIASNSRLKKLV